MAGKPVYSWIRVLKSDKERMEKHFRRKGVTKHSMMFNFLLRGRK